MSAIERAEPREVVLALTSGEVVDVLQQPDVVANYLTWIDDQLRTLQEAKAQAERAILNRMDDALIGAVDYPGGSIEKDPVDHSQTGWDSETLAVLYHHAPEDPELRDRYLERLAGALRPERVYKPLKRELSKLASERPDLAGIIADAEVRRAKPRHVRVNQKGHRS